ncbi:hypothetical protein JTE90_014510 [Oedothorax gibbosus]|uniref:DUF4806 domain-containing protein n=1 Tax=Oedothorax gibbosus TaxID=931172 RepID=A0AAV6VL80_9ARAC|nr:hypothetical protein JTE90_014510 [Oedothorax gibbosus]
MAANSNCNEYKFVKRKADCSCECSCKQNQPDSDMDAIYSKANEHETPTHPSPNTVVDSKESGLKLGKRERRLPARYIDDHVKKIKMSESTIDASTPECVLQLFDEVMPISLYEDSSTASTSHTIPMANGHSSYSNKLPQKNDLQEIKSLVGQTLKVLEKAVLKLNTLEKKVDVIQSEMTEIKASIAESESKQPTITENELIHLERKPDPLENSDYQEYYGTYEDVISEFNLPMKTNNDLVDFNLELSRNHELQARLTRHLHFTCGGKNLYMFLTSVMKKLLTKDLAMQYSRIGRKGKKSFMNLEALYRTVLATALMRFQHVTADEIDSKLGRSLALSSDWTARQEDNQ